MTGTATAERMAVSQKRPDTPISSLSSGEAISEKANVSPIEEPTIAMARVMTRSLTLSASMAVTAAEMAPAPWIALPIMTQKIESATAARALPRAKITRPKTMTGLRPSRSLATPKGTCKSPCVRPYMPRVRPTIRLFWPPGRLRA